MHFDGYSLRLDNFTNIDCYHNYIDFNKTTFTNMFEVCILFVLAYDRIECGIYLGVNKYRCTLSECKKYIKSAKKFSLLYTYSTYCIMKVLNIKYKDDPDIIKWAVKQHLGIIDTKSARNI